MNGETPQTSETPAKQGNKNMIAILSYLGILFLIPLFISRDNPFVKYHIRQGIVLFITGFIASFIIWIPFIGWAMGIALLVLMIIGIANVVKGKQVPLPIIGKFASKF